MSSSILAQTHNEKTFFQPIGDLPGGDNYSRAFGISANGKVVVGESSSESGIEAFYWSLSEGMIGLGDLPGGEFKSSARATSADGEIIVGISYIDGGRTEAFRWTKNDGVVGLGFLNEEQVTAPSSEAFDITADGTVIVGKSKNIFNDILKEDEAFRWENGVMTGLQTYMSTAYGVSSDGKIVLGTGNVSGKLKPHIWALGFPTYYIPQSYPGSVGYAYATSDNKTFVGGGTNADGNREAFRWVNGVGLFYMGFIPGMGQYSFAIDISLDGSVIVGVGNSGSDGRAFIWDEVNGMRDLKSVIEEDGVDLTGWILSSAQAISASGDTIVGYGINPAGNSEAWIAGLGPDYHLKRKDSNDKIEYFDVKKHAWSFGNAEGIDDPEDYKNAFMWPEYWWSNQFNYDSNLPYKLNDKFPINSSRRFPDWYLFSVTFGASDYFTFYMWKRKSQPSGQLIKKYWEGSCYGFAVSSLLSFDYEEEFITKFPKINWNSYLYNLNINDVGHDDYREVINKLFIYQWGYNQLKWDDDNVNKTPNVTLDLIKQMFVDEKQDDQMLKMNNDVPSGSHAIVPYKIRRDKNPSVEWIYVYDNNYPDDLTKRIKIENNRWEYEIEPNKFWSGIKGLYLCPPMSSFFEKPTLYNPQNSLKSETLSNNDYIRIFNTQAASITITNSLNHAIGFSDSTVYNNFIEGIPIIPSTGSYHPPIGYFLPNENYSIILNDFTDSLAYTTIFTDSIVYNYERFDASSEQTDFIEYENGLFIYNEDNEDKNINIGSIAVQDTLEIVFEINNYLLSKFDSLDIKLNKPDTLFLKNLGTKKNYDLLIRITSNNLNKIFTQNQIELAENSTHKIIPEWNGIDIQSIMILIDTGNVGKFNDTINFNDEVTTIVEENIDSQNKLYGYYLAQNFPNPINLTTTISYNIPKACYVTLQVFNVNGRLMETLVKELKNAGRYGIMWNANNYNPGIYYFKITAGDFLAVKKCILIK